MEEAQNLEITIGRRLREFRELLKISQTVFSLEIGISRERLASYESARVPLPWGVFSSITKKFSVNPIWLATGTTSQKLNEPFNDERFASAKPRSRFSDVVLPIVQELSSPEAFDFNQKVALATSAIVEVCRDADMIGVAPEIRGQLEQLMAMWFMLAQTLAGKAELKPLTKAQMKLLEGFGMVFHRYMKGGGK